MVILKQGFIYGTVLWLIRKLLYLIKLLIQGIYWFIHLEDLCQKFLWQKKSVRSSENCCDMLIIG